MQIIEVKLQLAKDKDGNTKPPGRRGYIYEAVWNNIIIYRGNDPEYGSCRGLLNRGYKGRVYFKREGRETFDSSMNIERGALYQCTESSKVVLRVEKFRPFEWGKGNEAEEEESEDCSM